MLLCKILNDKIINLIQYFGPKESIICKIPTKNILLDMNISYSTIFQNLNYAFNLKKWYRTNKYPTKWTQYYQF